MKQQESNDDLGMKIICLAGIAVLAKLVHLCLKNEEVEKEPVPQKKNDEIKVTGFNQPIQTPKGLGKNSWLHPSNDFGKMEKGVEY